MSDCIEDHHDLNGEGRPRVSIAGTRHVAARIVCLVYHGQPPYDKPLALHSCGNKRCINHEHLYWGDDKDNSRDRSNHGTHFKPSGELNDRAKLTRKQADDIRARARSGEAHADIARDFPVTRSQVSRIAKGTSW
jgi:hypothetical protein